MRSNYHQTKPLIIDKHGARNIVERFFGRIKEYRRAAIRHEKRSRNDLSTLLLTTTRYLLREMAREVY